MLVQGHFLDTIVWDHPVDHMEPLPEQGPERSKLIKQAVLRWHCGYTENTLAGIARDFGVTRSLVSKYALIIADRLGVPAARSDEARGHMRASQLARPPRKESIHSQEANRVDDSRELFS